MAQKKGDRVPEVRGILAQFHPSGLTQREFVEGEEVPLSTLTYWLRRERLEREIAGETALVAVAETSKVSEGRLRSGNGFGKPGLRELEP